MENILILHKREKDEHGNSRTQLIGAFNDIENLLRSIDIDDTLTIDNMRLGLNACGSFFIMNSNGTAAYDIYRCPVLG